MSASSVLSAWVQTTLTAMGARIFRNFVGGVWAGKKQAEGMGKHGRFVVIIDPTHLDAGLCVGSSDRIGWTPRIIGPEDVGQKVAIFTAVEEKTLAYRKLTPAQVNFLDQVVKAGGLGYVARETKDGPVLNEWPEKKT